MNTFQNPGQAPTFTGLDDAEVRPSKLSAGAHIFVIERLELFDGEFGKGFGATGRIESTNAPGHCSPAKDCGPNEVGTTRRWVRGGLTKDRWEESNRARVKQFLAACCGMDPSVPPNLTLGDGTVLQTWDHVFAFATQGNGDSFAGARVHLFGEDKTSANGHYVAWKAVPAPAE